MSWHPTPEVSEALARLSGSQEERIQRLSKAHDRYYEALVNIRDLNIPGGFDWSNPVTVESLADYAAVVLREV